MYVYRPIIKFISLSVYKTFALYPIYLSACIDLSVSLLSVSYRGSEMFAFIGSNFLALHVWAVRCRQAVSEEVLIALSRARSAAKFH